MSLTIEELHAFDDLPVKQRQLAEARQRASEQAEAEVDGEKYLFGKDGFTFEDFLDIINPLQHIPVISTIYREITGDEIAALLRILGGALFGGPIGGGAAILNASLFQETGKDIGEHVVALFQDDTSTTPTRLAAQNVKNALGAKPPEAEMATAAGWQNFNAVTAEPLNAPHNKLPTVKPSGAELAILEAEARSKQSAQVSFLTEQTNQRPEQAEAAPLVAPTMPEQQILLLEKAMAHIEQKSGQQKQAAVHIKREPAANVPNTTSFMASRGNINEPKSILPRSTSSSAPWIPFQKANAKSAVNTFGTPSHGAIANGALGNGTLGNGAVANNGGWFSDVMVSAMSKYEQGKKLKFPAAAPAVNQLN